MSVSIHGSNAVARGDSALLGSDGEPLLDRYALTGRAVLVGSVLVSRHAEPGAVVALLAPVSPAVYEFMIGARHAGLVVLVVDPTHTVEQIAFAINNSGATVLIAASALADTADTLASLTPYVTARYGLDEEFAGHRSFPLARSSAPVRMIDAPASGTLHHRIGPFGRPFELRLPDAVDDPVGRANWQELAGDFTATAETVLVESSPILSPVAAQLATVILAAGGGVAVPRQPTGVETLRTAWCVEATVIHLTAQVAVEIADLGLDRARRLTPAGLELVIVDAHGCPRATRHVLADLWGDSVRLISPSYLEPETSAVLDCSITHAEI